MKKNAKKICKILQDAGYEAFEVGGCIRDTLLNKDIKDIDITTNALPTEIQRLFPKHIDTGLKHGTVSVKIGNSEYYEVTTYRIDGEYSDGRHPDKVEFVSNIEADLSRRDFTINAIAFDPVNEITKDPFNGQYDLENKIIRAVGDPKNRFKEDPLRILRAMRFAIKLQFSIEEETKKAMHDKDLLKQLSECISKERITAELKQMLTCGKPIYDIFMEFQDIIITIFPDMKEAMTCHDNPWHRHNLIYEHMICVTDLCCTDKFEIKLAALFHDIGKERCRVYNPEKGWDQFKGHPRVSAEMCNDSFDRDLRLSKSEKEEIITLIEIHDMEINPSDNSMKKFIIKYGEEVVRDWIIIKDADLSDHIPPFGKEAEWNDTQRRFNLFKSKIDDVIENMNALTIKDLEINGNLIMNLLNIQPGPEVGKILKETFDAVVDGKINNNMKELTEYIKENFYDK